MYAGHPFTSPVIKVVRKLIGHVNGFMAAVSTFFQLSVSNLLPDIVTDPV
jgi:hypothetical protein